jgi:hypothetical protein
MPDGANLSSDWEPAVERPTEVWHPGFYYGTAENEMNVNVDQSTTQGIVTADLVLMDDAYDWLDRV